MEKQEIERIGYGSQFNNLFIIDNRIKKESKNEYGHFKIKKEIEFFKYIIDNKIVLNIPLIFEFGDTFYIMKYLKEYAPLYKYFPIFSNSKKQTILKTIYNQLNILHQTTQKQISKESFRNNLIIEIKNKIMNRYNEIISILNEYSFIKKVNGIILKSFDEIMTKIECNILEYINSLTDYNISIIHGDCQFNNILYNPDNNDLVFIDPRGYFGNFDLYGIPEYDYAKIRFALSGYDIFDNMNIISLNIDHDNLIIPDMHIMDNIFTNDIITTITISIWLGNAHCFKHNIPKLIYSFYYAIYLGTCYL